ncbi:MAG: hypothetical protein A2Z81_02800 [Omnitrophica WOR_2 bacterium GWA2_45_18]|nr:MAG: hypothetical protein A2Z81_02800 [Omnitrophica WOR_2 bacterium GWA2_45_18]
MPKEIKSLDIGTMNLVSASYSPPKEIHFREIRHAFLKVKVEPSMVNFLTEEGMQYAEIDDDIYILGGSAFKMACTMGKDISRPMKDGILNPNEEKAELILKILIEALIGPSAGKDSVCYYSTPAEPYEKEFRLVYHSGIIQEILESLGYQAKPVNEGLAVVYSGLVGRKFTGIGISCGCGLLNVCVSHWAKPLESFSMNRAGDWIDENAGKVLGMTASKVTAVKEKGVHLKAPQNRTEKAISIYYKELIRYAIEGLRSKLENNPKMFVLNGPIDIVCAGGTSRPGGFIEIVRNEFEKVKFPLEINEIYLADDPLYAIARGCLIAAIAHEGKRGKEWQ